MAVGIHQCSGYSSIARYTGVSSSNPLTAKILQRVIEAPMDLQTLDSVEEEIDRIKCLNIHASNDCSLKTFRC